MVKLKAGIIGLGVGEKHIDGYNSHPNCEVVAVCDFSDEKLAAVTGKYPQLQYTKEATDILEAPEIDVVSIASFDNYHYEQIAQGLTCNKHVFVEKPICLYKQELLHLRKLLTDKPHLKLSSNLILRMSPRFRWLKQIIKEEKLGELFFIEGDYNYGRLHKIVEGWRGQLDFYSVMYGGGIHLVDLLLWITGDKVVEVVGYGNQISSAKTNFQYNDFTVGLLKFESGMIGKVSANFGCVHPHFHRLSIYGTEATFVNGWPHAQLYTSRDPQQSPQTITEAYPGTHKGDLIYSFVESVMTNTLSEVSTEDVFASMSVCLALEQAINESKSVTVTYI